jgi:CheY-like chemotaxis protein
MNARPTVLLVDDEPPVLVILSRMLEPRGYATLKAHSAQEALGILKTAPPGGIHAVLCDVRMPETSGLDLALAVRRNWPELPVALMSAFEPAELRGSHRVLGGVRLLKKPFVLDDVLGLVAKLTSDAIPHGE